MAKLSLTHEPDWQAVLAQLPGNFEELAGTHKQLETQYGNAKITTAASLLRFILLHVGANLPLRQTVAVIAAAGGPTLSAMRLHMKMRRAMPYLRALVERLVGWTAKAAPELWGGYSLVLVDATAVCGPGATGTDARIHTKLRVADVAVLEAIVTGVSGGETLKHFSLARGELVLGDRLYANPINVAVALEQGADILVRHNRGSLPLKHRGRSLNVLGSLRAIKDGTILDLPVSIQSGDDVIHGRYVATRLPREQAEKACLRLRKQDGPKNVSAESLEAAGYVTLFTTVPVERMSAGRCLEAYRLRWQIELQFKRWKSLCGFDRLPNYRDDTIIAWLYAKVLLGIVLDRMGSIRGELSPPVQIASVERTPRRPRRRRAPTDGQAALEAHDAALPAARRRAPTALSA